MTAGCKSRDEGSGELMRDSRFVLKENLSGCPWLLVELTRNQALRSKDGEGSELAAIANTANTQSFR